MRLNQFLARHTSISRRHADTAIEEGRVLVDGKPAHLGQQIDGSHMVTLDGQPLKNTEVLTTIVLNKPVGYICSRRQQGSSPTIYALLPHQYHHLKPIGRLDKDSSGLLLMTNDGILANKLAHPSFGKWKEYQVILHKPLTESDYHKLQAGIHLDDGLSRLVFDAPYTQTTRHNVRLQEGRNRQIRRTFASLGYTVTSLNRINFGDITVDNLKVGKYREINLSPGKEA